MAMMSFAIRRAAIFRIAAAREQALLSAREILAEAIKLGMQRVPRFIVAVSEGGNEVAVIDVREIVPPILK